MNRSRYSFMVLALTAAILLSVSGAAVAREDGSGKFGRGYCLGPDLSPEQVTAAEKLHQEFFTATESLRQQIILKRAELETELISSTANPQNIERLSTELGALRGKMINERNALDVKLTKAGLPGHRQGFCGPEGRGGYGGGYGGGYRHGGHGGHMGRGHMGGGCYGSGGWGR